MFKNITNDSFKISGNNYKEFKENITKFDKLTAFVNVYITQSQIFSFKEKTEERIGNSKDVLRIYSFYVFDDETLTKKNYDQKTVNFKTTLINGVKNDKCEFFDKVIESTGLMIQYKDNKNRIYLDGVSKHALKSLCDRAGLRGERYSVNSFFRDAYLASGLVTIPDHTANKDEIKRYGNLIDNGLVFCRRKNPDNEYKLGFIVGVFAGDYVGIESNVLLKTYDYFNRLKSLEGIKLDNYLFTQDLNYVSFVFEGLSEKYNKKYNVDDSLKFGVKIYISDNANFALNADLFVEIYGIKYTIKNINKKQNNKFVLKEFTEQIKRNFVAAIEGYYKIIVNNRDIKIDENLDPSMYAEFLEELLLENSKLKKALGKIRIKDVSEEFYDYIIEHKFSNYYDFVMMFFEYISESKNEFFLLDSINNPNKKIFVENAFNLFNIDLNKMGAAKKVVVNG